MAQLQWNKNGERLFETGIDRVVLYPKTTEIGVPWNGVTALAEDPSGGDVESLYLNGVKYADIVSAEDYQATLSAYAAPKEFLECEGIKALAPGLFVTQQPRKSFHMSYRTLIGNDLEGVEFGYKLHLIANCTASASARANKTIAGEINPDTRSWALSTVPPPSTTYRPTAHLIIDSRAANPAYLSILEAELYGDTGWDANMPTFEEVRLILTHGQTTAPI